MLIPIGTTMEHKKQAFVTYWLIALNLLIFASQWAIDRSGGLTSQSDFIRSVAQLEYQAQLSSANFHYLSLISYQFLHAGWMHIILNMVFLLPFGKAVEDRMGHVGFALFYLGCGACAGFMHTLLYINPVIGASGSVCAVVSAFIVLAPKTHIKVLLVFFIIGVYTVPSMLLVCFFIAFDTFSLLGSLIGNQLSTTAWAVHLVGYLSGFIVTFMLLYFGFIRSSEFDLRSMVRQAGRRRTYRNAISKQATANFNSAQQEDPISKIRIAITDEIAKGNVQSAISMYKSARNTYEDFNIDPKTLHLLGSSMLKVGDIANGAIVFEQYISRYPSATDVSQVALLLSAKYIRNLNNPKRASELLSKYTNDLTGAYKQLAISLQKEINS